MAASHNFSSRYRRLADRLTARWIGLKSFPVTDLLEVEPRSIGSPELGRQILSGQFVLQGHQVDLQHNALWDLSLSDQAAILDLHGSVWLDHLAAFGGRKSGAMAQAWVDLWIDRFGRGGGPGWRADIAGRRVLRWLHHSVMLLDGADSSRRADFVEALAKQAVFISKRWPSVSPGLPRFEALAGLISAALAIKLLHPLVAPATRALAHECRVQIDATGSIFSRNPEELLDIFSLLSWTAAALRAAGWTPADLHLDAIQRIAPTLRMLRHKDGGLARFHGGGRGFSGRLDQALAASGSRGFPQSGLAMGFARLSAGASSVLIDAGALPQGRASINAHASSLAFELTSGRHPVIVNCGSGRRFGEDWRRTGRGTASHSTLVIEDFVSAELGPRLWFSGQRRDALVNGPSEFPSALSLSTAGQKFEGGHNGFLAKTGLTHARTLTLSPDGDLLSGEEVLIAVAVRDKLLFDQSLRRQGLKGFSCKLRFHLHPDIVVRIHPTGGQAVLILPNSETWTLSTDATVKLALESSVYLERQALQPRATKQVVLSQSAISYATRINWVLTRTRPPEQLRRERDHEMRYAIQT